MVKNNIKSQGNREGKGALGVKFEILKEKFVGWGGGGGLNRFRI